MIRIMLFLLCTLVLFGSASTLAQDTQVAQTPEQLSQSPSTRLDSPLTKRTDLALLRLKAGEHIPSELTELYIEYFTLKIPLPAELLETTGRTDPEFFPNFRIKLSNEADQALSNGDTGRLLTLKSAAEELFGRTDSSYQAVQNSLAIKSRVDLYVEGKNEELLSKLVAGFETQGSKLYGERAITSLSILLAEEDYKAGRYGSTITRLSRIPTALRTTRAQELALQAFNYFTKTGSGEESDWPFDTPEVSSLLSDLRLKDPTPFKTLVPLLENRAISQLRIGNTDGARVAFGQVLKERADPNEENNKLRLALAIAASTKESKSFAHGRVQELRRTGSLSIIDKVRLLFKGYYGESFPMIFWCSLGAVLLFFALAKFNTQLSLPTVNPTKFKVLKRERPVKGYLRTDLGPDEYSKLLEIFGLNEGASESEIKKAYRQAVKDCHPDKVGDKDPALLEKFRELTKAYERLLDMRKAFFFGR